MRVTHLGHACVVVETERARLLIDPGTLSSGYSELVDLDGILFTHQHADHLDQDRLPALIAANPTALVLADPGSAVTLESLGIAYRTIVAGERIDIHGARLDVVGGVHALVHADVPTVPNGGLVVDDGALYHPGDSFHIPPQQVDVFCVPTSGPWLKVGEAVDFLRAVAPRVGIPIHEAALANTELHFNVLGRLAPAGTSFTPLAKGQPTEL